MLVEADVKNHNKNICALKKIIFQLAGMEALESDPRNVFFLCYK